MSGHTNRNKRNGGNSKSRHGPPRQRGQENRPSQPKNASPPATSRPPQVNENSPELKPELKSEPKPQEEYTEPRHETQPPEPTANNQPDSSDGANGPEQPQVPSDTSGRDEPPILPEHPENSHPRGRAPFAAASRGGHAYIPASGSRQAMNGQNGQNGHHHGNGVTPNERRTNPTNAMSDYDVGETDGTGAIPANWRTERLNGGVESPPREPFRPESRGEVGSLIDSLHELFAQDRAVASQGDSARCGICYLHFPLAALEYRQAEGFFVCAACKRALGHNPLMMIRRQQPPHTG
jgi:hypothetical protein